LQNPKKKIDRVGVKEGWSEETRDKTGPKRMTEKAKGTEQVARVEKNESGLEGCALKWKGWDNGGKLPETGGVGKDAKSTRRVKGVTTLPRIRDTSLGPSGGLVLVEKNNVRTQNERKWDGG